MGAGLASSSPESSKLGKHSSREKEGCRGLGKWWHCIRDPSLTVPCISACTSLPAGRVLYGAGYKPLKFEHRHTPLPRLFALMRLQFHGYKPIRHLNRGRGRGRGRGIGRGRGKSDAYVSG